MGAAPLQGVSDLQSDGWAAAGACCIFTVSGSRARRRLMGSLVDELQRRKAAARAEAEQLRGQIARLLERLAGSRSSCRVRDGRGRDHADSGSPWTGLGRARESRAWT